VQCGHGSELRADGADANGVEIDRGIVRKRKSRRVRQPGSAAYEYPIRKAS
jgi:hypothetical protein